MFVGFWPSMYPFGMSNQSMESTMEDSSIDRFNLTIGVLLATLIKDVPIRHMIDYVAFAELLASGYGIRTEPTESERRTSEILGFDPDKINAASRDTEFVRSTVQWLVEHEFLTGSADHQYANGITLSQKGLALMDVKIEIKAQQDAAPQLVKFSKGLLSSLAGSAKDQLADFVGKALGSYTRSAAGLPN